MRPLTQKVIMLRCQQRKGCGCSIPNPAITSLLITKEETRDFCPAPEQVGWRNVRRSSESQAIPQLLSLEKKEKDKRACFLERADF